MLIIIIENNNNYYKIIFFENIVYFVKDSFILEIHNMVTLSFEKFFKVGSLIHFLLSLLRYSLHTVKYYPS